MRCWAWSAGWSRWGSSSFCCGSARFLQLPAQRVAAARGGRPHVGVLGWFFPEVLGVGYGFVGQALNGQIG